MNGFSNLRLYRNLLRSVQQYPSAKNYELYLEIKRIFKENRNLTDPKLIEVEKKKCRMGIAHMEMYREKNEELIISNTISAEEYETQNPKDENFIYF